VTEIGNDKTSSPLTWLQTILIRPTVKEVISRGDDY
jgi:hypothetical protein